MLGGQGERLFEAGRADHLQHRPENLLPVGAHPRRHPVEQGRADEEAVLIALQAEVAAVDGKFRAFVYAHLDVVEHSFPVGRGDHRTVLGVRIGGHSHLEDAHGVDQPLAQFAGRALAHRDHDRQGHAALPGRAEGGAGDLLDRLVEVGVGHYDAVVLGPAHGLDPLPVRRAGGIDVGGDIGGADEAHRRDSGVRQDGVHRRLVAVHHIEDSRGRPGLQHQLAQPHRDRWVLLRGLEHEGVAAGDGHAEHPHRDHGREIKRGDPGCDAQRLAHGVDVDAGAGAFGVFALQGVRNSAREFNDFQASLDIPLAVGQHLAVLGGEQARQLFHPGFDQPLELEHHPRPALRIERGPGRLGFGGGAHGGVDLLVGGEGHAAVGLASIRIEQIAKAARAARDARAGDEMVHGSQGPGLPFWTGWVYQPAEAFATGISRFHGAQGKLLRDRP